MELGSETEYFLEMFSVLGLFYILLCKFLIIYIINKFYISSNLSILFFFNISVVVPLLVHSLTVPHSILIDYSSCISKRMSPPLHSCPTRSFYSLGPQVSGGLGASFVTEASLGSPLLYQRPHISWCILPCWWLGV